MRLILFIGFLLVITIQSFAGVQLRSIRPDATDNRIKTFTADSHYICTPETAKQRNLLLIHLPASFHKASESSQYLQLAAREGYHVISLAYPGINNMYSSCEHSTDPPCYENFHREVAEGVNYSPEITIDTFESIFFRLKRTLDYLQLNYPSENWSYFLDSQGRLDHSRMIWSGHSDGAGHATAISKYYSVHRVVCFSGPKDFSLHYYLPPVWVHTGAWKTDKSRIYAFAHTSDDYLFQKEIWDSLGLNKYGPPVNVSVHMPPYLSSHQLITSASVSVADIHGSTVLDARSPKAQDNYVFEPVWKYVLNIGSSTSVKSRDALRFTVSPNPVQAGQQVLIQHSSPIKSFDFFDFKGRKIDSFTGPVFSIKPGLSTGIYFIRSSLGGRALITSLVVY